MLNVKYDYSSVHVDVPSSLANEIINWGTTEITDDDIFVTRRDPTYGREDEIHITILYGIHSERADLVTELLANKGPIKARLGKVDVFTNPFKFDVVMIGVISEDLNKINETLEQQVPFTNKYGLYRPHVTVAYVKKGKGWKYRGLDLWAGKEFVCDYAIFSSKEGFKQRIIL